LAAIQTITSVVDAFIWYPLIKIKKEEMQKHTHNPGKSRRKRFLKKTFGEELVFL
jgi:hypothetical protein